MALTCPGYDFSTQGVQRGGALSRSRHRSSSVVSSIGEVRRSGALPSLPGLASKAWRTVSPRWMSLSLARTHAMQARGGCACSPVLSGASHNRRDGNAAHTAGQISTACRWTRLWPPCDAWRWRAKPSASPVKGTARTHARCSRALVRVGRLFTGAAGDDPGVKFFSAGS